MDRIRHLITSQDWSLKDIDRTLSLACRLKAGNEPSWIKDCLAGATVTLLFNKPSTRSRILFHFAAVEMGGVPLSLDEDKIHPGEAWEELCTTLIQSKGVICVRLLPSEDVPYGAGEGLLRRLAEISDNAEGPQPPVISMSHDRCHPCQGLYELLTYQKAMGGNRAFLRGRKMLFVWTRGKRNAPASPTQDSLMMMTRMGMRITLCHPHGQELDGDIIRICEANTRESGGEFELTDNMEKARQDQDIIYARHWGSPSMYEEVAGWYCDEQFLGDAKYVHPMPVDRGVEASPEVVDGPQSLTRELIRYKYFVQKAVLAQLARR